MKSPSRKKAELPGVMPVAIPTTERSGAKKATTRVLTVLSTLAKHDGPIGITDLGRELGMTKNMVFRALATLMQYGYVVRDESGSRYDLGYKVLALKNASAPERDLRTICRPILEKMHQLTGETSILSIIVGRNRVNIDDVVAVGPRVIHGQRGRAVPLHITRTGRLLLAFQPDSIINEYVELTSPFSQYPHALVQSGVQLWDEIHQLRKMGVAIGPGEAQSGVAQANYISIPLLDREGLPHCTVSVGGPVERFTTTICHGVLPMLKAIISEFGGELTHVPAPPVVFERQSS